MNISQKLSDGFRIRHFYAKKTDNSYEMKQAISLAIIIMFFIGIFSCLNFPCTNAKIINKNTISTFASWKSASTGLPITGYYNGVAFGDVNGDGLQDVVAGSDSQGIGVFLGDGNGNWTPVPHQPVSNGSYGDIKLCDLFGDGHLDIVAASPGGDSTTIGPGGIYVFKGDGKGGFVDVSASTGLIHCGAWRGLAVGDVNHDGRIDIAACSGDGIPYGVHVYVNMGNGKFKENSTGLDRNYNAVCGIVLSDFNNDGNLDIAVGGTSNYSIHVYLGNGGKGGQMIWQDSSSGLPSYTATGITAVDFDNNGVMDLAISRYDDNAGLCVFKNMGNASSWVNCSDGLPTTGYYVDIASGDFNGDGYPDLVTGNIWDTRGIQTFYGNGKGNWTEHSDGLPTSREYCGCAVGDFNNDGKTDLLFGRYKNHGIEVWENTRPGPPVPVVNLKSPNGGESWSGNSVHDINWTTSSGTFPYSVTLRYSTDGGLTYPDIIAYGINQDNPGNMSFEWNIPAINSMKVKVKIDATDTLLQNGSVSSLLIFKIDSTAPKIIETFPADNTTNIYTNTQVIIDFSEQMDQYTTVSAVSITGTGTISLKSPIWSGTQLIFKTVGLQTFSLYNVTISVSAKDTSDPGNHIADPYEFSFTTGSGGGLPSPIITSTFPRDEDTSILPNITISIQFNLPMNRFVTDNSFNITPNVTLTPAWSSDSTMLKLSPSDYLDLNTEYFVTVSTDARSQEGANMTLQYLFSFTTVSAWDPLPPNVISTDPANGTTDLENLSTIVIAFSVPMNETVTENAVSISPSISLNKEWDVNGIDLNLTSSFENGTNYSVIISTEACDIYGVPMDSAFVFSFSTENNSPVVIQTLPEKGDNNVDNLSSIIIIFSDAMNRSATDNAISITPSFNWIPMWSSNDTILTLESTTPILYNTVYTIHISPVAKSTSGFSLSPGYVFSFKTVHILPIIIKTTPENGEQDVGISSNVIIVFNEPMNRTATDNAVSISHGSIKKKAWDTTGEILTLTVVLQAGKTFTVSVSTNACDISGTRISFSYSFTFETKTTSFNQTLMIVIIVMIPVVIILLIMLKGEMTKDKERSPKKSKHKHKSSEQ